MNREDARELASEWIRAHGQAQQQIQGLYNSLALELVSLLPDEAVSGTATIDGRPTVIACAGSCLVLINSEPLTGGHIALSCRRFGLSQELLIELTERVRQDGPLATRDRSWTFHVPGGPVVAETTEVLSGPFSDDRGASSGELVARAVARAVGWTLPGPDPPVLET